MFVVPDARERSAVAHVLYTFSTTFQGVRDEILWAIGGLLSEISRTTPQILRGGRSRGIRRYPRRY
jgi:hypothetical protein